MRKMQPTLFLLTIFMLFSLLIAACSPAEEPIDAGSSMEASPTEAPALAPADTVTEAPETSVEEDDSAEKVIAENTPTTEPIIEEAYPVEEPATSEIIEEAYPAPDEPLVEVVPIDAYPTDDESSRTVEISPVDAYPDPESPDPADSALVESVAELGGAVWELAAFVDNGIVTPVLAGTQVSAEFTNGQINGSTGCNQFGGSYAQTGNNITINEVAMTRKACEGGIQQQETHFADMLRLVQTFSIEGNNLSLQHPTGTMQFVRLDANATSDPAPAEEFDIQPARIDTFSINVDNEARTATVTVSGNYSNGCLTFDSIFQDREDETTLSFVMLTRQPLDAMCTQVLVPFEMEFPLDISGLESGTYTIFVNDQEGKFALDF